MKADRKEIEYIMAYTSLLYKTIIINGQKQEMSPKAIIQNIYIQYEELLKGTKINEEFPEGLPLGYENCINREDFDKDFDFPE